MRASCGFHFNNTASPRSVVFFVSRPNQGGLPMALIATSLDDCFFMDLSQKASDPCCS